MKIAEFLDKHALTYREFAYKYAGMCSPAMVYYWVKDISRPRKKRAKLISQLSRGEITLADLGWEEKKS